MHGDQSSCSAVPHLFPSHEILEILAFLIMSVRLLSGMIRQQTAADLDTCLDKTTAR